MKHQGYLILLFLVLAGCSPEHTPKENLKAMLKGCGQVILQACAQATGGRAG